MKKKFDAVAFQRKARAKISKKIAANPEAFLHELREKYGPQTMAAQPERRRK